MILAVSLAATGGIYLWGVLRARRAGRRISPAAIGAFFSGLAAIGAAAFALDGLADDSMSWHMAQHLVLISVAAPLLLVGAPIRVALAALPTGAATRVARVLNAPLMRFVDRPVFGLAVLAVVLYGTHFSPLYEAALENEGVHAFEHLLYVAAALAYWSPIFAIAPAPHAAPHPARILALFLTLPMSAFLGFAFYVENHVLYTHYAGRPDALADQANAGAVMWLSAGTPVLLAILWCVADWGARERRAGAAYDAIDRRGPIAPVAGGR